MIGKQENAKVLYLLYCGITFSLVSCSNFLFFSKQSKKLFWGRNITHSWENNLLDLASSVKNVIISRRLGICLHPLSRLLVISYSCSWFPFSLLYESVLETFQAQGSNLVNWHELTNAIGSSPAQNPDFVFCSYTTKVHIQTQEHLPLSYRSP